jgi:valyl-tRNA synthetase
MSIPLCSRTGDILEPMLKEQWFLSTEKMFEESQIGVENDFLKLIPESRKNLWNQYTNNFSKDWCLSRQLWWGHQIPAYKCSLKKDFIWVVARNIEEARAKGEEFFKTKQITIEQDEDVFDTWFSSAILPLAIFGWPDLETKMNNTNLKFKDFYPTNLLETGFDIMFFWVLRMAAVCHTLICGKFPFEKVLFHGLILDGQGRKMSKSIGNVIDPMDLIDGTSLTLLENRIKESNLNEKEKKLSIKNQQINYPNGIPQVGCDAMRLGLLIQDFKSI